MYSWDSQERLVKQGVRLKNRATCCKFQRFASVGGVFWGKNVRCWHSLVMMGRRFGRNQIQGNSIAHFVARCGLVQDIAGVRLSCWHSTCQYVESSVP